MQLLLLDVGRSKDRVLFVYCSIVYICNNVLSVVSFFIRNRKCCCILIILLFMFVYHFSPSLNYFMIRLITLYHKSSTSCFNDDEKSALFARYVNLAILLSKMLFLDAINTTAPASINERVFVVGCLFQFVRT